MAWETKDKVQATIACTSIAISLFTFTIVEQHRIEEQRDKRAMNYRLEQPTR
ncbi:MAG TPA: hypothetical protein VJW96_08130 [Terriglobales bacterium]|jgi:hypothetical protein|nr:hypothetical protein [Terriglobales bacterium]